MQERTENESKINYWYKQYLKAPAQLVGFGALLGIGFIYHDAKESDKEFREYMRAQIERSDAQNAALLKRIEEETRALSKMTIQIELLNGRLGHVEHVLETKSINRNEENRH